MQKKKIIIPAAFVLLITTLLLTFGIGSPKKERPSSRKVARGILKEPAT